MERTPSIIYDLKQKMNPPLQDRKGSGDTGDLKSDCTVQGLIPNGGWDFLGTQNCVMCVKRG